MQRGLAHLAAQLQYQGLWGSHGAGMLLAGRAASVCASMGSTQGFCTSSRDNDSNQQAAPALLTGLAQQSPLARLPPTPRARLPHLHQQVRFMAGGGESDSLTHQNTWPQYRSYVPKRNDLSAALYLLILTFGFSHILNNNFMFYPPRVLAITGFVFFVLYTRKY